MQGMCEVVVVVVVVIDLSQKIALILIAWGVQVTVFEIMVDG